MNSVNFKVGLSKKDDIPRLYIYLVKYEKEIKLEAR